MKTNKKWSKNKFTITSSYHTTSIGHNFKYLF